MPGGRVFSIQYVPGKFGPNWLMIQFWRRNGMIESRAQNVHHLTALYIKNRLGQLNRGPVIECGPDCPGWFWMPLPEFKYRKEPPF